MSVLYAEDRFSSNDMKRLARDEVRRRHWAFAAIREPVLNWLNEFRARGSGLNCQKRANERPFSRLCRSDRLLGRNNCLR
jgi:hypothetical protein